jgi:hypothetical protein
MTPSKQWVLDLNWQDFEKLAIRVAEANGYYDIEQEGGSSGGPDAINEDSDIYFEFSTDERGEDKVIEDIEKVNKEYICQENNYNDSIEKLVIIIAVPINKKSIQDRSEVISAPFEIDIYDIEDIIDAIDTLSEWFNEKRIDQIARFDSDPKSPFQCMSDTRYVVIENHKIHENFDVPSEFQFDVYVPNIDMKKLLRNTELELFTQLLCKVSEENYEIVNCKTSQDDSHNHIVCHVHGPGKYIPVVTINAGRSKLFILSFTDQSPD